MKSRVFFFALLSVAALVASAPAQAQNGTLTRSFVSSAGSDTNACTITAPCASFAQAYTVIGANGIIAALDPGKYGSLNITGPVTVNGNGWAAITGLSGGNGITVNISGGTGNVILTGLEIDGAGAGYNGIAFESGASLTVSNCIVKDFVVNPSNQNGTNGNGIWIGPTSGTVIFTIVNTVALNNAYYGIAYFPQSGNATVVGTIDHVFAAHNTTGGIVIESGGSSATVSVSNSVLSNNSGNGIYSNGASGTVTTTIDNDQISNNSSGVVVNDATVLLSRSVITKNSQYGVNNNGTVDSFQDNRITANGSNNNNNIGGSSGLTNVPVD
jgi:hypothetical protein